MPTKKMTPAAKRTEYRHAMRRLEAAALREADAAFSSVFDAVVRSAEIKAPALAHGRSGTIERIVFSAFESAAAVRRYNPSAKRRLDAASKGRPPRLMPNYLRIDEELAAEIRKPGPGLAKIVSTRMAMKKRARRRDAAGA